MIKTSVIMTNDHRGFSVSQDKAGCDPELGDRKWPQVAQATPKPQN